MSEEKKENEYKKFSDPLSIAQRTSQKIHFVADHDKAMLLVHLLKIDKLENIVVVVKTKKGADTLQKILDKEGISAKTIHANKGMTESKNSLKSFNDKETSVLIVTDSFLASARFTGIDYIVSFNLPLEVEDYLVRMGVLEESGEGIAFVSEEEQDLMDGIEWKMKVEIAVEKVEGFSDTPKPHTERKVKDKTKKPRHRKTKRKGQDQEDT